MKMKITPEDRVGDRRGNVYNRNKIKSATNLTATYTVGRECMVLIFPLVDHRREN